MVFVVYDSNRTTLDELFVKFTAVVGKSVLHLSSPFIDLGATRYENWEEKGRGKGEGRSEPPNPKAQVVTVCLAHCTVPPLLFSRNIGETFFGSFLLSNRTAAMPLHFLLVPPANKACVSLTVLGAPLLCYYYWFALHFFCLFFILFLYLTVESWHSTWETWGKRPPNGVSKG